MCFSCHDGSVADSRSKVWTSNNHVSGKAPPEWVEIPTDKFPLDENGHMTCATCHSAHAIRDDSDMATTIFLRQPNLNSSLCLFCHAQFAEDSAVHHPLGRQTKMVPEAVLHAGGRTSADGYSIFCQTCHEPHGSRHTQMLILPPSQLCVSCHTDKSAELADSNHEAMHRVGRTFAGFRPPPEFLNKGAQFGPQGELSCLSCHRMHRGAHKQALLIQENKEGSLCRECHKDQQSVIGSMHDLSRSGPDVVNIDGVSAAESGACGGCHKSHGWARKRRAGEPAHSPLCVECHLAGGLASQERLYVEAHPIDVSVPSDRQVDLPLSRGERKLTCSTCHDPHSSDDSISMLRMPAEQLCTHCHEGKQGVFAGVHAPAKSDWARELGFQGRGLCTDCHPAHEIRAKPAIWALLKEEETAPSTCEGCHRGEGPAKPVKTRHLTVSMDAGSTFPLVEDDTSSSGKIACVTCHEIHQEQNGNKLLRASRRDSRLCLDCHPDSRALFGTPHDFRNAASGVREVLGEDVEKSGPCETCHLVHDPPSGTGPWAFQTETGQGYVESLCLGCHKAGEPGERIVPQFTGHPDLPLYNRIRSERVGFLPTYNWNGEPSSTGIISCLSCHDPHVYSANLESDNSSADSSMGKFLRPFAEQKLCVDCHGKESIIRYLYFHKRDILPFPRYLSQN